MKIIQEFKQFIVKGNVIDLAVGIVIGLAFGKIVSSFVADVIMPPIGILLAGVDFSNLALTLKAGSEGVEPVLLKYGVFINAVIDFLIIGFIIFMVVKGINSMKKKEEEKPSAPPAPSKEEVLLAEIRDELRKK
jgi:large conductance mechanosensitive channel